MTLTLAAPAAGSDDVPPPGFPHGHSVPPQATVMLAAFDAALDSNVHPLLVAGQALAREHLLITDSRQRLVDSRSATAAPARSSDVNAVLCRTEIRAAWIEKTDTWSRANLHGTTRARLHTCTFGEVVDQLAQAWAAAERISTDVPELEALRLRQRLADQVEAYDALVPELVAGRVRVPVVSAAASMHPSL